jgi:Uma2 family endonuclease
MNDPGLMTADELLKHPVPNKRTELLRGRLVVREPAGFLHGYVVLRVAAALTAFVDEHRLGVVVAAETGFKLETNPDTVRAPDVGFITNERVPDPIPRGFGELAPDLVVEVQADDDRPAKTLAKVADWLEAGARLVWVVDVERRRARVYRADGSETLMEGDGSLDGEDLLPGLSIPLARVLPPA